MTDEDAILAAQTIADFVAQVNEAFELQWPAQIFEAYTIRVSGGITSQKVRKDESIQGYIIEDELNFFATGSSTRIRFVAKNLPTP